MEQNPKNCRNNCPFSQTTDCPAIAFEQKEHLHGFSQLVITVSQIIGCSMYPESALPPQPITEPVEQVPPSRSVEPAKKAPCPGAPKKKK